MATVTSNLNPQCKSEEKINQFIKSKWCDNIKFDVQVLPSTGKVVNQFSSSPKKKQLGQQFHQSCLKLQRLRWGVEA